MDDVFEAHHSGTSDADRLRRQLDGTRGANCVACDRRLCGHEALFAIALGVQDTPRCLACLAQAMNFSAEELRDHLYAHFLRRNCYAEAWRDENQRESYSPDDLPRCLWLESPADARHVRRLPSLSSQTSPDVYSGELSSISVDSVWDAGDMACGELVLALRNRLNPLASGAVLKLIARDPGAPEDIPAWCRLTGHRLLSARHPEYLIQRKEN